MKKIISILLAVLMLCSLSVTAFADTFETNLFVDGKMVTTSNASGKGWSYDHATTTLTLDGFNGTLYSDFESETPLKALKVVLVGNNTVVSGDDYFNLKYISDVTIEGTGSLTVSTPATKTTDSAASFTRLTINSGTINITTDRDVALHAEVKLTFNGGTLNLSATKYPIITYVSGIEFAEGIEVKDVKFVKYDFEQNKYVECSQAEAQAIEQSGSVVISKTTAPTEIKVLESKNLAWTPNSKDGVMIRFDMDIKSFVKLVINKKEVDKKYYTLKEGSTIVTLSNDYLKTLNNGSYNVEAYSTNGIAKATFTVSGNLNSANNGATSPKTGDTSSALLIMMLAVSSMGLCFVLGKKRFER